MQWIPEHIVGIGEDFHGQVDDGKVKTTLYKVPLNGYDRTDDMWEPIFTSLESVGKQHDDLQKSFRFVSSYIKMIMMI